jgi:hypothetical protein
MDAPLQATLAQNNLTLSALAEEVEKQAKGYEKALQDRALAEQLQTRLDELSSPAGRLGNLIASVTLLRQVGLQRFDRKTASSLATVERKLAQLAAAYAADPKSITAAHSVCTGDLQKLIDNLHAFLSEAWKEHIAKCRPGPNLLTSFDRHAKYQAAVNRLRALTAQLDSVAGQLPSSPEALEQVAGVQAEMQKLLSTLPDLSPKIRRFLQDTVGVGVTLEAILADRELVDWITSQGLAADFRVFSAQARSPQGHMR